MKEVIIDARASAKKAEAYQAQSDDTPDTFNYEQAFSGFGRASIGLGAPGDAYYGSPYAEETRPYADTFILIWITSEISPKQMQNIIHDTLHPANKASEMSRVALT